jgi:hypothetical protein
MSLHFLKCLPEFHELPLMLFYPQLQEVVLVIGLFVGFDVFRRADQNTDPRMLLSAAKTSFSTARLGPADSDFSISARIVSMTCASVIGKIGPLPFINNILWKVSISRLVRSDRAQIVPSDKRVSRY